MNKRERVCILPAFKPSDNGGVAVHVNSIRQHLSKRGWDVIAQPDGRALVHTHAMARAPQVDVYTNHGVYPVGPKMADWQRDCNTAIFENLRQSNQVIAVSHWTASQWQRLIGLREYPAGNLHIIPNGINLADWRNVKRGHWRAKLRVPDKTPLVLWGKASLSDVLDPTPALELALRYPEIRVVAPLPAGAISTPPKNFIPVGLQPFPAMQMLIADCDVYLATVCENHSIQVLEAMALSRPILGYAHGGTLETLDVDGTTQGGVLVTPGDLDELAEAFPLVYDQRSEYGATGYARVQAYELGPLVDRLIGVYELAEESRKAAHARSTGKVSKCSIVIPVYNKAPYVEETIRSALTQVGAPAYELIIVDDGSKDASLEVILLALGVTTRTSKKLLAQRKAGEEVSLELADASYRNVPIKVFARHNAGVSAARNFGITQAHGEYICCLDADDTIDTSFLARLSAALDADPGLGIAYSDMLAFGVNDKGEAWDHLITCSEYDFEKLTRGNFIPCCNLFRRTAWERAGGYKNINPSWEDYELWLNIGKLGWPGRRVPGGLFHYRKLIQEGRDHESHGHEWKLRGIVNKHHRDLYPPTVSFVIPCYKQARFLSTAIDSILAQTFPDYEIVVVDDGNEADEAQAIADAVQAYAGQPVRLERMAENGGLASARNAGIRAARGAWIAPLDADDWIAPTWLEKTLGATGLDPKKFAYTDSRLMWIDEAGATVKEQELISHDYDFEELLRRLTWPCTILYSREAWTWAGGYKPLMSDVGGWEDWEFVVTLGELGVCGVRVPEQLFFYRQHSKSQMRYTAETNKPRLQETMRRLHAGTYRGERGQMCCGRGRRTPAQAAPQPQATPQQAQAAQAQAAPQAQAATDNDTVLVRYVGNSFGTQTWRPRAGGRAYKFGVSEPMQKVARADADWFASRKDFRIVGA